MFKQNPQGIAGIRKGLHAFPKEWRDWLLRLPLQEREIESYLQVILVEVIEMNLSI